jgi:hypothetical protein
MSFSTIFFLLLLAGAYKLGVHQTRYPGDLYARTLNVWKWLNQ